MESNHKKRGEIINCLLEQNKTNLNNRTNAFNNRFTKITKGNEDITDINNLLDSFINLENKLFNRRVIKFLKVCNSFEVQQLRNKMNIENRFSSDYQRRLLTFNIASKRASDRRRKPINRFNSTSNITYQSNSNNGISAQS